MSKAQGAGKSFILLGLALSFLLLNSHFVFSAVVENPIPGKITKAISSFLIAKDPTYSSKKITVTYKYADKIFRDLKARNGDVTFSVVELYPDFKPVGSIIVPVQVYVDGQEKEKLFLRTKVSVYDDIVVAKTRLQRGDIIGTVEAVIEERDIAALNSGVIRDLNDVYGKQAKTYIPKENPIYDFMVMDRPLVKRNDKVKMLISSEGILISADGIAMEDGNMGQTIKVKNLTSGKEIMCIVNATGEVTIQ